jgi:hypothetical protein
MLSTDLINIYNFSLQILSIVQFFSELFNFWLIYCEGLSSLPPMDSLYEPSSLPRIIESFWNYRNSEWTMKSPLHRLPPPEPRGC